MNVNLSLGRESIRAIIVFTLLFTSGFRIPLAGGNQGRGKHRGGELWGDGGPAVDPGLS